MTRNCSRRRLCRAPRPLQMGLPHPQTQLIRPVRVVADHQVPVGIGAGGPAAEGLGPVGIREHVMGVAVALRHRQGRVEGHPENQIGQLAQPAADVPADLSQKQHHALLVTLPGGGFSDAFPVAESLAGIQDQPVQPLYGQLQICHLILLPDHFFSPEVSHKRRGVGELDAGEPFFLPGLCPTVLGRAPQQIALPGVIRLSQPQTQPAAPDGRAQVHLRIHNVSPFHFS